MDAPVSLYCPRNLAYKSAAGKRERVTRLLVANCYFIVTKVTYGPGSRLVTLVFLHFDDVRVDGLEIRCLLHAAGGRLKLLLLNPERDTISGARGSGGTRSRISCVWALCLFFLSTMVFLLILIGFGCELS